MQVLILEDEPLVAAHLVRLVHQLQPDWQLLGPLASLREANVWLQQHPHPDLILADIQLSDGISLDLFNHLQPACPVIFTTAYDHYAIRAFKINSIDYLLKPVDVEELENAFKKFALLREKYSNPVYLQELMQFVQHQQRKQAFKESFTVHYGRSVYVVPVGEIVCFTKQELIYLHQADGRQWITDFRSLDEVEDLLDPQKFYRANRQCIVQKAFLSGYRSDDTGKLNLQLKMVKPLPVMVSKDKAAAFKEWITP
jgi:two-component system, LytTR family, response regulator